MASLLRRTMVMLGLVDDEEYDDYEQYDEPPPVAPVLRARTAEPDAAGPQVRTLPRDYDTGGVTVQARPAVRAMASPRVHVLQPQAFSDAQEIGDRIKRGEPVIVNLQEVDPGLSRRLIDFCSGATYVLDAKLRQVATRVFLLTPSNVEVSEEEKRRLQERGLYQPNR
jgi:cell division inhibitor SepF